MHLSQYLEVPLTHTGGSLAVGPEHDVITWLGSQPPNCLPLNMSLKWVFLGVPPRLPTPVLGKKTQTKPLQNPQVLDEVAEGWLRFVLISMSSLSSKWEENSDTCFHGHWNFNINLNRHLLYAKKYYKSLVNCKLNRNLSLLDGDCCSRGLPASPVLHFLSVYCWETWHPKGQFGSAAS